MNLQLGNRLFQVIWWGWRWNVGYWRWPPRRTRDDLGARTDYSPSSGGFNNLIGSLSTLGLIAKPAPGYVALSDWAQELLQ